MVPSLSSASTENAIWSELIGLGVSSQARILCHGLAGLHAAPFALGQVAAVVIDDPQELGRALELCSATATPLILSEAACESADLETEFFAPGYRRAIVGSAGIEAEAVPPVRATA